MNTIKARWARVICAAAVAAAAALPAGTLAAPVFINPLATTTGVEAFAVNSYVQPGSLIARRDNPAA